MEKELADINAVLHRIQTYSNFLKEDFYYLIQFLLNDVLRTSMCIFGVESYQINNINSWSTNKSYGFIWSEILLNAFLYSTLYAYISKGVFNLTFLLNVILLSRTAVNVTK